MNYAVPAIDSEITDLEFKIVTLDPHILVDFKLQTDDQILI